MKNQIHRYTLLAGLYCTVLCSCIKVEDPVDPPPGKPDMLLTEIRTIYNYQGSGSYRKALDVYHYNNDHKPWLHVRRISDADTTQLSETMTDTLYYDELQRVTRVVGYQLEPHKMVRQRIFHYDGTERLPSSAEFYEKPDEWTDTLRYSNRRYVYQDTVVLVLIGADTIRGYYSPQGNFQGWYSYRGTTFDNLPNIELFFNLEHGLALNIPDNYGAERLPLYSKNNWVLEGPYAFAIERYMTANSTGQVVEASWRDELKVDMAANAYFTYSPVP